MSARRKVGCVGVVELEAPCRAQFFFQRSLDCFEEIESEGVSGDCDAVRRLSLKVCDDHKKNCGPRENDVGNVHFVSPFPAHSFTPNSLINQPACIVSFLSLAFRNFPASAHFVRIFLVLKARVASNHFLVHNT